VTDVALRSRRDEAELLRGAPTSEVMFRFLGTDVRVVSANVGLLQHWAAEYRAFRVPPGPAAITVHVHGDGDGPLLPGRVTIESRGVPWTWWGDRDALPPLAAPPLDRWVYLRGAAVCRAGQAMLLVAGPRTGTTVLAMSVVARGLSLLADGIVPLDPRDLLLAPFPKALRFRREALSLLSIEAAHPALTPVRSRSGTLQWRADPHALLGSRTARAAAEVGGIAFLDPATGAGEPRLEPLAPEQALRRLLRCLQQPPSDAETAETALRRLCRSAPAYTLTPATPDATAALVDELLG